MGCTSTLVTTPRRSWSEEGVLVRQKEMYSTTQSTMYGTLASSHHRCHHPAVSSTEHLHCPNYAGHMCQGMCAASPGHPRCPKTGSCPPVDGGCECWLRIAKRAACTPTSTLSDDSSASALPVKHCFKGRQENKVDYTDAVPTWVRVTPTNPRGIRA